MSSNSSRDSQHVLSPIQRIKKLVDESEIELTPLQISQKTNINRSTVRNYLRKLLSQNKIHQPYKSAYCNKITYGMIFVPLRFHNIVLTTLTPWLDFSDDTTEWTGGVKVRVQYGLQRHKITGRISCDSGMDKNAVLFALNRFYDLVKEKTGKALDLVDVATFENNRDIRGVRIDGGIKCVTKQGLFGIIERIYQKEEDLVRVEQKVTKPMRVEEFQALLRGGVPMATVEQGQFMLIQDVRKLTATVKFIGEQVGFLSKVVQGLTDAEIRRQNRESE